MTPDTVGKLRVTTDRRDGIAVVEADGRDRPRDGRHVRSGAARADRRRCRRGRPRPARGAVHGLERPQAAARGLERASRAFDRGARHRVPGPPPARVGGDRRSDPGADDRRRGGRRGSRPTGARPCPARSPDAAALNSLERFAAIVASSDDAILSKDRDGVITSWNPGAQRMYGYTEDEAVGQPISILIPPQRRGEERRILDQVLSGERIEHYETERLTKDGREIVVSLTVSPIRDADGVPEGAAMIARDISDRHRTLSLASRLQALTSALSREITRERALTVLLDQAVSALGADAGAVGLVDATGTEVELLGTTGHSEAGLAPWHSFPLDANLPMSIAIRRGEGVWTTSCEELGQALPGARGAGHAVLVAGRDAALGRAEAVRRGLAELQAGQELRRRRARVPLRGRTAGRAHARARAPLRGREADQRAARVPRRGQRAARRLARPRRHPAQARRPRGPSDRRLVRDRAGGRGRHPAQRGRRSRRSGADRAGRRVAPALPDRSRRRHRRSRGDSHRPLRALSRDRRRAAGRVGPGRRAPADDARARPGLGR